ncbi:MAG: PorV/PorQ family protein [Elusimicrobiota bacterium]|jgi:hypothetical protein
MRIFPGKRKRTWHGLFLLSLAALLFETAAIPLYALESGAAFLRIGTGARAEALGGAYTALASDINALRYNPGGLGGLTKRELGFTHAQWLMDSQFDVLGFAQPLKTGSLGIGMARLGMGNIEGRSADRQVTGGFTASDSVYTLGYGRPIADALGGKLGAGFNVKYLESRIGSDSASTFAVDFGAMQKLDGLPMTVGLSVLNIGQGLKFLDQRDPLPLTLAVGGAYRLAGAFNIALDVRHEPQDKSFDVGIGTEYSIISGFALRAGYASASTTRSGKNSGLGLAGLGGGFGLRLRGYSADYTFTPFGELGNVQRLSLGARF